MPPPEKKTEPLIGVKAIAEYLNRSERTVHRYIESHGLPVVRVGGLLEAMSKDLDEWRGNGRNGK